MEPHLTLGQQVAPPPQALEGQMCSHRQILIGSSLCQRRTRVPSEPAFVSMHWSHLIAAIGFPFSMVDHGRANAGQTASKGQWP